MDTFVRGVVFAAVIIGLAYLEAGPVVGFGIVILIVVSFAASDTQDLIKSLAMRLEDYIARPRDENHQDAEIKGVLRNLMREMETMSSQLRSMDVEMQILRTSLTTGPRGPWEA